MEYTYLGHSSFLLESLGGTRIVTDPYPQSVMPHPVVSCDLVTLSHHHFDHDDVSQVAGNPLVYDGLEKLTVGDVSLYGVDSFHDDVKGQKRGKNTIYVFEMDGLRLAHLGDLGTALVEEQIEKIGKLDYLFIPVGGTYTIDPEQAAFVARQLNAKKVVPMHYSCPNHSFELHTQEEFWAVFEGEK